MTLLNPFSSIFRRLCPALLALACMMPLPALSVVAGWIAGRPDAIERTLQVLPLMLAFGFFSNLTYATTGSLLRGWLAHGQRLLVFNRCMAAALVLTAVWMLWSVR